MDVCPSFAFSFLFAYVLFGVMLASLTHQSVHVARYAIFFLKEPYFHIMA